LEDANTLVSIGSMFLAIGDTGYATRCLLKAVEIDCANADAYYYLGIVSAIKGELEDAAELFSHTLEIENEYIPALRDSTYVYLVMDKLNDAAERISKARALDDDDPQLKRLERTVIAARIRSRIMNSIRRIRSGFAACKSIL
jgi:tetratricopeptide (TPR) repeat protein